MEETLGLYEKVLKEVEEMHPNIQRSAQRKVALHLVDVISEKENFRLLSKYNNEGDKSMRRNKNVLSIVFQQLALSDAAGFFPEFTQSALEISEDENTRLLQEFEDEGVIEKIYIQYKDDVASVVELDDVDVDDKGTVYDKYIFTDEYIEEMKSLE